jgi:hypothetical protein
MGFVETKSEFFIEMPGRIKTLKGTQTDPVISLVSAKTEGFFQELVTEAFPPEKFYSPHITTIMLEIRRPTRGHFNLISHETGFKSDIYLAGADPLHRWAMNIRRTFQLEGVDAWLAPPEYVIIRKLEFHEQGGGDRHTRDIANMIRLGTELDRSEIESRLTPKALAIFQDLWNEHHPDA